MNSVWIILPSRGRPARLTEAVEQIIKVSPSFVHVLILCDHDDTEGYEATVSLWLKYGDSQVDYVVMEQRKTAIELFNYGLQFVEARHGKADAYVLGEDDVRMAEGWCEQALAALDSIGGSGYIGLNGMSEHLCPTNYMLTRDWMIEYAGGVISPPCYASQPGDLEMFEIAIRSGKYVWADGKHSPFNSICKNMHPYLGRGVWDSTYENRKKQGEDGYDMDLFRKRQAEGFKIDWLPAIS